MQNKNSSVGRPKTFEKEEILKLAMHHFWEYGYSSTSLDELLKSMGIKKSSFYRTFKSKEEVFSLSLDLYRKETFAWLNEMQRELGTKEALTQMVKTSILDVQETGKVKGCLLMNSTKENYQSTPSLRHQIDVEFDAVFEFVKNFIKQAKAKGEITNPLKPKKIAMRYLTIYNGIIMMLQARADTKMVKESLGMVDELLK
jgi:AcrR family transcriptional regulator